MAIKARELRISMMLFLILAISTVVHAAPLSCPNGTVYNPVADLCYLFGKSKLTFSDAEQRCVQNGGHLTSISNAATNSFLASAAKDAKMPENIWIGFTSELSGASKWEWTDASPVTYTNWRGHNEPKPDGPDRCAVFQHSNGDWHDHHCGEELEFVCTVAKTDGRTTTTVAVTSTPTSPTTSTTSTSPTSSTGLPNTTTTMTTSTSEAVTTKSTTTLPTTTPKATTTTRTTTTGSKPTTSAYTYADIKFDIIYMVDVSEEADMSLEDMNNFFYEMVTGFTISQDHVRIAIIPVFGDETWGPMIVAGFNSITSPTVLRMYLDGIRTYGDFDDKGQALYQALQQSINVNTLDPKNGYRPDLSNHVIVYVTSSSSFVPPGKDPLLISRQILQNDNYGIITVGINAAANILDQLQEVAGGQNCSFYASNEVDLFSDVLSSVQQLIWNADSNGGIYCGN